MPSESEQALGIQREPACHYLRSKGMYVTGLMNPEEDDPEVGDGHCWCGKTQHALGPDDKLVSRRGCNSGRQCYQAVL